MKHIYIILKIKPFIFSILVDLSGTPTIIETNIPPTKPPIWAELLIPGVSSPIIKLSIITGIIELRIVAPR